MAASGGRPVEADIPFWFGQVKAGKKSTLDTETMWRVWAVTIMAYRNTAAGPDGTLAIAAAELRTAAALGRPVRIGQETNDLGTDPTEVKQTFYGQTQTRMNDQLAQVDSGAAAYATYAGVRSTTRRGMPRWRRDGGLRCEGAVTRDRTRRHTRAVHVVVPVTSPVGRPGQQEAP